MSVMTHSVLTKAGLYPTRYLDQMRKRNANSSDWAMYVYKLKEAAQRWAHDEDIVAWVRRTLCEIGA